MTYKSNVISPEHKIVTVRILLQMGFPSRTKGFDYLCTAITVSAGMQERGTDVRNIYARTAKIHDTTSTRVERDIRYCMSCAKRDGVVIPDTLRRYGFSEQLPTALEFIRRTAYLISSGVLLRDMYLERHCLKMYI